MSKYGYLNQPYIDKVLRHTLEHPPQPGTVSHVMVEHADWCLALLSTGHCICRATVRPPKREELRRLRQLERQARKKAKK